MKQFKWLIVGVLLVIGCAVAAQTVVDSLLVRGHAAIGAEAVIDGDVDTSTLTLKDTQTQTTDHAIGVSNTIVWSPHENPSDRYLVGYDALIASVPTSGAHIPGAIGSSVNHQLGGVPWASGSVGSLVGYVVNTPADAGGVSVNRNIAIAIEPQTVGTYRAAIQLPPMLPVAGHDAGVDVPLFQFNARRHLELLALTAVSMEYRTASFTQSARVSLVDASAGSVTVTLPPAASMVGVMLTVRKVGGSGTVWIDPVGTDGIDGVLRVSETVCRTVISIGPGWYTVGRC